MRGGFGGCGDDGEGAEEVFSGGVGGGMSRGKWDFGWGC